MYKKILVPLDGSELAEKVLPHVTSLAKALGAELSLVTVIELSLGMAGAKLEAIPAVAAESKAAQKAEAAFYLQKVQQSLKAQDVQATIAALEGDVASEIISYAEEQGFDLIAMATHGRSGIGRFIMGSIAEKVVRGANKPVLLIRAIPVVVRQVDWRDVASTPGTIA